jgi:hypothetical protein
MPAYCHAIVNGAQVCVPPPTSTASDPGVWPLAIVVILLVACIVRLRCAAG